MHRNYTRTLSLYPGRLTFVLLGDISNHKWGNASADFSQSHCSNFRSRSCSWRLPTSTFVLGTQNVTVR